MKIERGLLPMVVAGRLVYAGAAYSETEKQTINQPPEPPIAMHRVNEKSAAVNLTAVGKEVAPGVVVVDPDAVYNTRLMLDGKAKHVCLGKWITIRQGPMCEGTWVEW